jgi:hypothetical protein
MAESRTGNLPDIGVKHSSVNALENLCSICPLIDNILLLCIPRDGLHLIAVKYELLFSVDTFL